MRWSTRAMRSNWNEKSAKPAATQKRSSIPTLATREWSSPWPPPGAGSRPCWTTPRSFFGSTEIGRVLEHAEHDDFATQLSEDDEKVLVLEDPQFRSYFGSE